MELLLAGFLGRRVHRRSMSKEHLDAKAIHDGTAPPRERAKSLNLRSVPKTTDVAAGDCACDLPGCGTKGRLSHHNQA